MHIFYISYPTPLTTVIYIYTPVYIILCVNLNRKIAHDEEELVPGEMMVLLAVLLGPQMGRTKCTIRQKKSFPFLFG